MQKVKNSRFISLFIAFAMMIGLVTVPVKTVYAEQTLDSNSIIESSISDFVGEIKVEDVKKENLLEDKGQSIEQIEVESSIIDEVIDSNSETLTDENKVDISEVQGTEENTEITIFHTNDTHGRVKADKSIIGIDTISAIKKSVENSLLVDAGDTLHGLPFATMNKGADIVNLMKMAGYDLMVPGNHDFNYGYERLLELAKLANEGGNGFDIISANTIKGTNTILNSNKIKEINGIKVGIFGLSSPETAYKTNPNNIKGITFEDPIVTAEAQVKALKNDGADVVIALAHIGDDDSTIIKSTDIAEKVNGIDIIIDGHSHSKYENGLKVNDTLIVSTGQYESNLGKVIISINKNTKEIVSKNASLISKEVALTFTPDSVVKEEIAKIDSAQNEILSKVIGKTANELDGVREHVRTAETNLGNLIADAILNTAKAEIAITNGGGIRASIAAGNITKGDIVAVLPFGNFIVSKYLTGAQIKDVLEHGVKDAPAVAGQFTHVAGLKFVYDEKQPVGNKVISITFNGQPLDMNKKYLVATNDFMAAGGDGFPHFGTIATENEFSALDEALEEYIENLGTVDYNVEGRITTGTAPKETEITIFHTNDTHGRVKADKSVIGIDTIAAIKKSVENSLLVDAGDTLHGLPFATMNKGADIVELMKMAGYDLMVPGNHDFNYGYERLLELAKLANEGGNGFDIISANVAKGEDRILKANSIKEINGVKVGIFGLSSPETAYKTNPNNVIGLEFVDPIATAEAQVKALKEAGADVVIALAHIGDDESTIIKSTDIAEKVNGIDAIIDGHSHSKYENGLMVGDTLIVSAGQYEGSLGKLTISVDKETKKIVNKKASLISKVEALEVTPDAEVLARISEIDEAQNEILSQIIGKTVTELDGVREHVRAGETNLGNLIADAILNTAGAEIAITNGGGIRASIAEGNITKGDIISVLPFGNFIVTKYLTGQQIKDVIEHGIKDAPNVAGQFPHVAGLNFVYDSEQPVGSRIVKITFNGEPLEMDKKYLVATNDFIAAGGDGFPHFGAIATENEFSALDEVLVAYIEKLGTIDYKVEGRITTGTLEEEIAKEDLKAAEKVINEIDKLPNPVTLKDKKAVEAARKSYSGLTESQKVLVSNYKKLLEAEAKIAQLEEEEANPGLNSAPVINAKDVTLKVGEKFDPLKGVTAKDKEDGILTSKIKVTENTVNTAKAGVYKVTYSVTDSQGATTTLTIKVTVKAKGTLPQTGGQSPMTVAVIGLVAIVGGVVILKKKKVS